jgi:cytoskeleton protein RodZ
MGQLGELLRKAREEKGLSLQQAEEATKIRAAYLQALEEETLDLLPAQVYVKGFIRNYASALGLHPQEVLALYKESAAPQPDTPIPSMLDEPLRPLSLRRLWPLGVALLVLALAAAVWQGYIRIPSVELPFARPTPTYTAAPTAVPPSPTARPTHTALPPTATFTPTWTPVPAPALELTVDIVGLASWIRAEVDGQEAYAGTLEPGSRRVWSGRERIVLRAGRPEAVRVTLNGQLLGWLGPAGQVVEKEWAAPGVPTRTPLPTSTKAP